MSDRASSRRNFLRTGSTGLLLGFGGCLSVLDEQTGDATAQFEFSYDASARTVEVRHAGGSDLPAGDVTVETTDGDSATWSELGSTTERADQAVTTGSTARIGADIVNWPSEVGPPETVRVLYVPDEQSVTTLDRFEVPTPTATATPSETPTNTPTSTPAEELFSDDFEDGTLDGYTVEEFPGDDDTETYHITSDPSKGEYAVKHRTESRYLEPKGGLELEPPLTISLDFYVDGMSGIDIYPQYDVENDRSYRAMVRHNFNGQFIEVSKTENTMTDGDSEDALSDRNENSVFDLGKWEKVIVTWAENGELTAEIESTGETVSITDDELTGHAFRLVGYHYSGWAAFDNLTIERGLPSDE